MMENIKISQIIGTKRKKVLKIFLKDEVRQQPIKKSKEKQTKKYYRNDVVKMGVRTSVRGIYVLDVSAQYIIVGKQ